MSSGRAPEEPWRSRLPPEFLGGTFRNLDDRKAWLRHWLDNVANPRVHATTRRVINEAFAEEKPHLKPGVRPSAQAQGSESNFPAGSRGRRSPAASPYHCPEQTVSYGRPNALQGRGLARGLGGKTRAERISIDMGTSQHQKLYNTNKWKRLRRQQRQRQPLCAMCKARNIIVVGEVADHIRQHRGNETLFYDPANLQSLCKECHDVHKARAERSGRTWSPCVDPATGWPLDPLHPANLPRPWCRKAGKP